MSDKHKALFAVPPFGALFVAASESAAFMGSSFNTQISDFSGLCVFY
jgi:uncharacterized membrane-anchored protein